MYVPHKQYFFCFQQPLSKSNTNHHQRLEVPSTTCLPLQNVAQFAKKTKKQINEAHVNDKNFMKDIFFFIEDIFFFIEGNCQAVEN